MPASTSSRLRALVAASAVLVAGLAVPTLAATKPSAPARPAGAPADRYDLAGGCFGVQALGSGRWLAAGAGAFAATAPTLKEAEPFRFQASDLSRYLLFGSAQDFLAADTSPLADGGTTRADAPGPDSDFRLDPVGADAYRLTLQSDERVLTADESGALSLAAVDEAGEGSRFTFRARPGCAVFPESEIGITGPTAKGASDISEVKGYLDTALHGMAYEFIGGKLRCGAPFSPYGVTAALVDCPDHGPNGATAAVENTLSYGNPVGTHDTTGWPTFVDWPAAASLTHEQVYYRWLERAYRGGLRMMTELFVDNAALCKAYPLNKNTCNEMENVKLQAQRARELERYIDAQSGGPGEGWFRIVTSPAEARRVANSGKLAVVLGIEVSTLFDCGLDDGRPLCDEAQIDEQLDEVYRMGVRQLQLVNKFDSALSGVAGDAGPAGYVINAGNKGETGRFWDFRACPEGSGAAQDKTQFSPPGGDVLAGAVLQNYAPSGAVPVYGSGPQCNVRGLSKLGEYLIERMIDKGMILDTDHMSALARKQALTLLEKRKYSGVMTSHGWSTEDAYPRMYALGGLVTPYAGGSAGFVEAWKKTKAQRDPKFYFGFGFGSDINGLGAQGQPRADAAENPVTYPFTGFGGVKVDKQRAGERVYDINVDGVAQYGLYPDWIEDLRRQAGQQIVDDLARGPEAYLQMWERATGIGQQKCDGDPVKGVRRGMTAEQVLRVAGQPDARVGSTFTYCASGDAAVVRFGRDGRVSRG